MSKERFLEIILAYGVDPARWPEGERAAAQAFYRDNPDLVDEFAAARNVDERLDEAPSLEPSEALTAAIMADMRGVATPPVRESAHDGGTEIHWAKVVSEAIRRHLGAISTSAVAAAAGLVIGVFAAGAVETDIALSPEEELAYFASESSVFQWIEESEDSDA